jgi:hypothetical protein
MITDINQLDLNKTYSYADYLTLAISRKTGIDKRKIFKMSPAPSTTHQRISGNLHGHLFNFSNRLQSFLLLHLMFD